MNPEENTLNYFAYGSNMNPARMKARKVEFLSRISAHLLHFKLCFNMQSTTEIGNSCANIIPVKNRIVEGVLYQLQSDELLKLDPFEGYPLHYDKQTVTVLTKNNVPLTSITYIATDEFVSDGLFPSQEYLSHLLAAKENLSKFYYEKLTRTPFE